MTQQASQAMTVVATGNGSKGRGVTWTGTQAGANASICGIADTNFLSGEAVRVIVGLSADAEAGAAIDGTETRLMTDASGRLIPWTTGNTVAARLVPKPGNTAAAAGQFVEVVPIQS